MSGLNRRRGQERLRRFLREGVEGARPFGPELTEARCYPRVKIGAVLPPGQVAVIIRPHG